MALLNEVATAEKAAAALSNMAYSNSKNQDAIRDAGGIVPLCTLVRDGSSETKEQSALALWALYVTIGLCVPHMRKASRVVPRVA